jgi:hypothetical protein
MHIQERNNNYGLIHKHCIKYFVLCQHKNVDLFVHNSAKNSLKSNNKSKRKTKARIFGKKAMIPQSNIARS